MLPVLREVLIGHKAASDRTDWDDHVLLNATGTSRDNLNRYVVQPTVRRAQDLLARRNERPLPDGLTTHKLRHTFISVLYALGHDPAYVSAQVGHADEKFTLKLYAHTMRRSEKELAELRALVEGRPLTAADDAAFRDSIGTRAASDAL